jgi:cellulose 1,4-beta-cellobiosidase
VNQFKAEAPEPFMVDNVSWDESHYVSNIAPYLQAEGLPTRFIVDQGRVAVPGTRDAWSEWCNVSPAGFGTPAGTPVDNPLVDSIVWIKPGGESDGRCGEIPGAPVAGSWFNAYAEMLARNAHASLRG